jgi:pimeloyl-[acyl-carrier protein] methyl ester esterase
MTAFVFVHGWGFGPDFWRPLQELLGGTCIDLGYGSAPSPLAGEGALRRLGLSDEGALRTVNWGSRPVIAVGHSFGFAWLLHHRLIHWDGLVSINGFARFTSADGEPDGVSPRVLARMIARFKENPAGVHSEFLKRCGVAEPQSDGLQPDALGADLDSLADWDERDRLRAEPAPVLALAGRRDPIVSPAQSEKTFRDVQWQDQAGHLLPHTHPRWCAERIFEFVASHHG